MSTPVTSSEYMLLFKGTHWDHDLSPEEVQDVMTRWTSWLDRLTQEGKVKSAQPLANQGKIVAWKKGVPVDGPFAESKEAIGGYFLLQVSEEEALEIDGISPERAHQLIEAALAHVANKKRIAEEASAQASAASAAATQAALDAGPAGNSGEETSGEAES